ncbi:hypothetical protein F511_16680 [Dorcoceras hygrometricum]|uniref:Ubiquitin-like protease family profile domain-containing protein n=1 Tax=Dorcoceras hygrometricum TaxID=472368 RepID=A0A2Z7CQ33_9LAMI|nr:hypothetical protein F511_16680 [Dorcoceras hygrometricum]
MVKRKATEAVDMELQERTFGTNHVSTPSAPHQSSPHHSPPHDSPSRLQRLEERMTVVEAQLTMMMQQQANMMDILKSLQSYMLSFKIAWSPVITAGELALSMLPPVSEVTWTGSSEVAGWTKVTRMFQLSPVRDEESGSRESTPEAEQRMEIIIQRSWTRTELEIEHLSDGEKKRCFITAYERGWFLKMATLGTWFFTDHVDECFRGLLELQKAYAYIFRGDVAMMDTAFPQIVAGAFIEGGPTNVERMFMYMGEKIDDWPTTPWDKASFILVSYCFNSHWVLVRIVPKVNKLSILNSDRSVDSNDKILLDLIAPLAHMLPHILVAMGVQTDTDTRWNIVRPKEFPEQSLSDECGVYVIAAATFTLADRIVYTLKVAVVADFWKFCTCSLWNQSLMLN